MARRAFILVQYKSVNFVYSNVKQVEGRTIVYYLLGTKCH